MAMPVLPFRTLYVGDLHASVTEADLSGLFLQFAMQSIRLCRDRITQKSLRYAYVNFARQEDAEMALRKLNYTVLKGRPMRIMWSNRDPYNRKTGQGNLFVKNLGECIGAAQLERVFASFGTVVSCKVVYDEYSGKSKCFGFVQMNTQEEAQNAISALNDNPSTGLGDRLYVTNFVKKNTNRVQGKKNNLYIRNLEGEITDEVLREKFSRYGKVTSAVVMKDLNGKSKEFGFVCFENLENAETALEAMNGFKWGERELYVGYAQKKAERKEFLAKKFANTEDINKFKGFGVFVKNLDESLNEKEFEEHFAGCGKILYKKILLDRGFGFIYFSTQEQAIEAVKTINGTELKNKKISVTHVLPKEMLKKPNNTNTNISTNINANSNANTSIGTKINPNTPYIPYTPIQQPMQQSYFVPNSYYPNIPYTNAYNVQPAQNAWSNYNYNYGYNYVQPAESKSVFQAFDPYFQCNIPVGSGWNNGSTSYVKSGIIWKNNNTSFFGGGAKQKARNNNNNNNNHKKFAINKPIGPRKSRGPIIASN